jgi:hypothetical protein
MSVIHMFRIVRAHFCTVVRQELHTNGALETGAAAGRNKLWSGKDRKDMTCCSTHGLASRPSSAASCLA